MENLPLIRWHAQKLHDFLSQKPINPLIIRLVVELEGVLNSPLLRDVVPVDFVISAESVAAANEAELKRKQARNNLS